MNSKRKEEHKRNNNLENLLNDINNLLYPVENNILSNFQNLKYPIVLIMGGARSGTTLTLQWLAESGYFAYPTNMMSRFYKAPYIGAKIQLMLTKYDHNNEISKSFNDTISYESTLGKTTGALAPHESWYFWRRFFKFDEIQKLTENELNKIEKDKFVSELSAIESVFDKPLAMKGMNVNWHIPYIEEILDNVLFIHVKRKPLYQIQSIFNARKKYYGTINEWYSFKPPEYKTLKNKDPYTQIAGQVYYTNKAIEKGFKKIDNNKCMTLEYEKFCKNPKTYFDIIKNKINNQGIKFNKIYNGPSSFDSTNKVKLSANKIKKIEEAYKNIAGENISK